jgi:hypothetical protein
LISSDALIFSGRQRIQQQLRRRDGHGARTFVLAAARAMGTFFRSLLAQAVQLRKSELDWWIESATHLIYHAMFADSPSKR